MLAKNLFDLIPFELIPLAFPVLFVWHFYSLFSFSRLKGKVKRGVPIWRQRLTKEQVEDLRALTEDQVSYKRIGRREVAMAFILVRGDERLINPRRENWGTSWPTLGYVRLDGDPHNTWLQYRTPLAGLLFLLPFCLIGVGILMLAFNLSVERHFMRLVLAQGLGDWQTYGQAEIKRLERVRLRLAQEREQFTQRFISNTNGRSEFTRLAGELEEALTALAEQEPIPPHKMQH